MEEFVWKVLLVVDDTQLSEKALDCTIDLATSLKSKVYVFYVKDEEPIAIPSEDVERKRYAPLVAKANKKIIETVERLKEAKIDYEVVGYHIGIANEVVRRIECTLEPDLIIIGAEKSGVLKKLLGNGNEKIIFETDSPVLVVKSKYTPKIRKLVKEAVKIQSLEALQS
jgi:nucleotide-binding universal stress UspA family protein